MSVTTEARTLGDALRENIGRKKAAEAAAAQGLVERRAAMRVERFRKALQELKEKFIKDIERGVSEPTETYDDCTGMYRELDSLVCIRYPDGKVLFQGAHPLLNAWFEFFDWAKEQKLGLGLRQHRYDAREGEEISGKFTISLVLPEDVEST